MEVEDIMKNYLFFYDPLSYQAQPLHLLLISNPIYSAIVRIFRKDLRRLGAIISFSEVL